MPNLLRTTLEAHLQSSRRRNFVVWTPIWVNQNSISCVSTSSFTTMFSNSSLEILLYSKILNILQNKWEQHNSWNSLESNPTTMLCSSFHAISCNSWWLIMSISDYQQRPRKLLSSLIIDISNSLVIIFQDSSQKSWLVDLNMISST
jgi:hypothetical protein